MGLWEILKKDGDEQNIANVKALAEYAAGKLTLIRETFPDYTMHDRQHAENVIALTEKLLGPAIDELRPLEAAMLILAAYFHDIGMVYHPDELAALVEDEDFKSFLDENPAAYVRVREAGEVPRDVIVQYCRARHADRVAEHLFQLDAGLRTWDGVGIGTELAMLCRSHMQRLDVLRSEKFSTGFLGSCDLRMCAILLRLADILDLVDNRAPAAIYDHLRLAGSSQGPRAVSDTEWAKHIASRGFRFPAERSLSYSLLFLASPRKPSVEHATRKFLDVVEEEFRGCRILLDFCDARWRSLALPSSIDRSGIVSDGYRYGEYRFTLDRHEVLRLFMGDQLYSDPYTFIRELLQNAVDACRLNVYLHNAEQSEMEVRVSAWEDKDGNYWLRVDDTGVGMDQEIVEKYFLGVGRSYYRSDELEAEILRKNKQQQKFVAISRFGIGALSSFIVGDRVEVSTRRRLPDGKLAAPLRLSLDSLDDFFVMQDHPMRPSPFPGRNGADIGYRKAVGTSVAVRIDPTKSDVALEGLLKHARKSLFFPPVKVYFNDVEQRGSGYEQLDIPLLEAPIRLPVTDRRAWQSNILLASTELSVAVIPLDLTANSPTPSIRGQLVAIGAEATGPSSLLPAVPIRYRTILPPDLIRSLENCIERRETYTSPSHEEDELKINLAVVCQTQVLEDLLFWLKVNQIGLLRLTSEETTTERKEDANLRQLLALAISASKGGPSAKLESTFHFNDLPLRDDVMASWLLHDWLGHNGISVSTYLEPDDVFFNRAGEELDISKHGIVVCGLVCLFDELRPHVSASRDTLRDLSFEIRSALHLAVRRAAKAHLASPHESFAARVMRHSLLLRMPPKELTVARIESDPFTPEWRAEQIISLEHEGMRSADEIRLLARSDPVNLTLPMALWSKEVERQDLRQNGFYESLQLTITELELDIELEGLDDYADYEQYVGYQYYRLIVRSDHRATRPAGLSVLPPFAAVRYITPEILIKPYCPANLRNPIVAWLAEHAAMLVTDYPALFVQFRRALAMIAGLGDIMAKYQQGRANRAAELMNVTLNRLRRSIPDLPRALFQEVYADESGQLLSR